MVLYKFYLHTSFFYSVLFYGQNVVKRQKNPPQSLILQGFAGDLHITESLKTYSYSTVAGGFGV